MSERPGTLYRLFATDGTLLYVGCSSRPLARLEQHGLKPWFAEVASVSLVHFANYREAAQAEIRAIAEEGPKYNIAGNPVALADQRERRARLRREAEERRRDREENFYRANASCTNCGQGIGWVRKGFQVTERDCPRCGFKTLQPERQAA